MAVKPWASGWCCRVTPENSNYTAARLEVNARAAASVLDTHRRRHATEHLETTIIKSGGRSPYLQFLGELSKAPA
jgi:hypothetical protein